MPERRRRGLAGVIALLVATPSFVTAGKPRTCTSSSAGAVRVDIDGMPRQTFERFCASQPRDQQRLFLPYGAHRVRVCQADAIGIRDGASVWSKRPAFAIRKTVDFLPAARFAVSLQLPEAASGLRFRAFRSNARGYGQETKIIPDERGCLNVVVGPHELLTMRSR